MGGTPEAARAFRQAFAGTSWFAGSAAGPYAAGFSCVFPDLVVFPLGRAVEPHLAIFTILEPFGIGISQSEDM